MKTGSMVVWPNGGTPPIAYPLASLARSASALVTGPPARAARRAGLTRLAPLTNLDVQVLLGQPVFEARHTTSSSWPGRRPSAAAVTWM